MIRRLGLIGVAAMLQAGCVAAVLGSAPDSGTAADTRLSGANAGEARLQSAVRTRLAADAALRGANVQVNASGSVVTLRGTALSASQRSEVARVAKATSGVSAVVNQLKVP
jgi:osmotically-inducible protein OsmY